MLSILRSILLLLLMATSCSLTGLLRSAGASKIEGPPITVLSNQTVKYGRIADFECRVPVCYTIILKLYINGRKILPKSNSYEMEMSRADFLQSHFEDRREYNYSSYCDNETNEDVVSFWIVVNSKNIEELRSINCSYNRSYRNGSYAEDNKNIKIDFSNVTDFNDSAPTQCKQLVNTMPYTNKAKKQSVMLLFSLLLLFVTTCLL